MVEKIGEKGRSKLNNNQKSADNQPRRQLVNIRISILNSLKVFPMTAYEISVHRKIDLKTVQRQLHYLNELNKVEKYVIPTLNNKELWRLKKKTR